MGMIPSDLSDIPNLGDSERGSLKDEFDFFEPRELPVGSGTCKACIIVPSPRRRSRGGGELIRGGRGGAVEPGTMLNVVLGGGGRGPAVA